MKLYLYKDDNDDEDEWHFSLVPFEELEPEDNVISTNKVNNFLLDAIYKELNIKNIWGNMYKKTEIRDTKEHFTLEFSPSFHPENTLDQYALIFDSNNRDVGFIMWRSYHSEIRDTDYCRMFFTPKETLMVVFALLKAMIISFVKNK